MNHPVPSINELKVQLYCRDVAIQLAAVNLVDFFGDGPWLWCGDGYIAGILEPEEHWQQVDWAVMPLLADLYRRFGEPGLYIWCAWQRNSPMTHLTAEVRRLYSTVKEFITNYQTLAGNLH